MIWILTTGLTRPCVKPGFLDDRCITVERRTHPENAGSRCSHTTTSNTGLTVTREPTALSQLEKMPSAEL